jgi:hypothetical protein
MKKFVKENWYKLMVGSSMMMASFGFMIYAISPVYSNNNDNKLEIPSSQNTTSPVGSNGVIVGDYAYFVDNGTVYMYHFREKTSLEGNFNAWNDGGNWAKHDISNVQTW